MASSHNLFRGTAIALLTIALVACGGSDAPAPGNAGTAPTPLPPSITAQPVAATVDEGDAACFAVQATGTAPLAYQWRRNGSDIAGDTAASYTRVVRLASLSGKTGYQMCPEDSDGTLVPLEDIRKREARLRYEWLRNGVTIPGATSASYTIDAPTTSDNGARFSVIVSNCFGSAVSRDALLTIGEAPLKGPTDIAFDASGDAYTADTFNGAIRKLSVAGVISTYAGASSLSGTSPPVAPVVLATPMGVVSDASGNVYVAEFAVHRIRRIAPDGLVTNFAGEGGVHGSADGTGTAARFTKPQGPAIDGAGNIYVADTGNQTIRKITLDGVVTTLAGLAGTGGYPDGSGSAARFEDPEGIAVDSAGNVYAADRANNAIRKISPAGVVSAVF